MSFMHFPEIGVASFSVPDVEDVDLIDAEDVVSGALGLLLVDRGSPAEVSANELMLMRATTQRPCSLRSPIRNEKAPRSGTRA